MFAKLGSAMMVVAAVPVVVGGVTLTVPQIRNMMSEEWLRMAGFGSIVIGATIGVIGWMDLRRQD